MEANIVTSLAALPSIINESNDALAAKKDQFHSLGLRFMMELARDLGIEADSYRLTSLRGGPGICGDVVFHSDNLYIHLFNIRGPSLLYRECFGIEDYKGGKDEFVRMDQLAGAGSYGAFLNTLQAMMAVNEARRNNVIEFKPRNARIG